MPQRSANTRAGASNEPRLARRSVAPLLQYLIGQRTMCNMTTKIKGCNKIHACRLNLRNCTAQKRSTMNMAKPSAWAEFDTGACTMRVRRRVTKHVSQKKKSMRKHDMPINMCRMNGASGKGGTRFWLPTDTLLCQRRCTWKQLLCNRNNRTAPGVNDRCN
jgi:hypothetical protein